MIDSLDFYDAMANAGLEPPYDLISGRFYRFPGIGKPKKNRAAWCILFEDGKAGCFGDWSTGLFQSWYCKHSYSTARRANVLQKIQQAKAIAAQAQQATHEKAAEQAAMIWHRGAPALDEHPYLRNKQISKHGARCCYNELILPIIDIDGALTSLQFIKEDGVKRLLRGGRKQGCMIPVELPQDIPEKIIICEGWATGCTLADNDPGVTVLAAIDAGNLESVAWLVRQAWPSAVLIIAGDDDRQIDGNPGASKAHAAALAAQAELALPQWPKDAPLHLTDFNDLATWLKGNKHE